MELATLIKPLRKWWWLILAATLLAGGTSYLVVRDDPVMYQARATLMLGQVISDPSPTNAQITLSQQLAPVYANLARLTEVRRATAEALGLDTLPSYTVNPLPNTQLMEIVVLDTDPRRSQAVANELANQLIRLSPGGQDDEEQERREFINNQLDDLQLQIEETQAEITVKQQELAELVSAQQIQTTSNELQALQTKLTSLQTIYTGLLSGTTEEAVNALALVEEARPGEPAGSTALVTVLTAAALGLVISTAAAYALEFLDDTVKDPGDVASAFDLPALACIPVDKNSGETEGLVTAVDPRSTTSEAFRSLRTSIVFPPRKPETRTILITSTGMRQGKSFVAANLATVLAQAGRRVLLIDADLRIPTQHKIFGVQPEKGLVDLVLTLPEANNGYRPEISNLAEYTKVIGDGRLHLLTAGTRTMLPAELLGSQQMRALMRKAQETYDYVIVDSPPVLAVTDAQVLSAQVDAVLLVVESRRTRRMQVKQAVTRLQEISAPLLGLVINRYQPKKRDMYVHYRADYGKFEEEMGAVGEEETAPAKRRRFFQRS